MANILRRHENIRLEKLYKFRGILWQPVHSITHTTGHQYYDVESTPYCPKCRAKLTQQASNSAICELCEIVYPINPDMSQIAGLASKAFNAKLKEGWWWLRVAHHCERAPLRLGLLRP